MATVKLHLEEESNVRKGIFDRANDSARDRAFVEALGQDADALHEAAVATAIQAGDFHHSITDLPLQTSTAQELDGQQALVTLDYRRTSSSNPTLAPFNSASIRPMGMREVNIPVRHYEDGSGNRQQEQVLDTDRVFVPEVALGSPATPPGAEKALFVHMHDREWPIKQITVPAGRLTDADIEPMADMEGAYNSDAVVINNRCFPADTLRFIAVVEDSIDQGGSPRRYCRLVFHYRRIGWGDWDIIPIPVVYVPSSGDGFAVFGWYVDYDAPSPTKTFAGSFNVWDPTTNTIGVGPVAGSCLIGQDAENQNPPPMGSESS